MWTYFPPPPFFRGDSVFYVLGIGGTVEVHSYGCQVNNNALGWQSLAFGGQIHQVMFSNVISCLVTTHDVTASADEVGFIKNDSGECWNVWQSDDVIFWLHG